MTVDLSIRFDYCCKGRHSPRNARWRNARDRVECWYTRGAAEYLHADCTVEAEKRRRRHVMRKGTARYDQCCNPRHPIDLHMHSSFVNRSGVSGDMRDRGSMRKKRNA